MMSPNSLRLADVAFFEELRRYCANYFRLLPYWQLNDFSNPDLCWLHEEYSVVRCRLLENGMHFVETDLVNVFYSVVFESEFKRKFFPGSLIVHCQELFKPRPQVARLIRFQHDYPNGVVRYYAKSYCGKLLKDEVVKDLSRFRLVVLRDPLCAS